MFLGFSARAELGTGFGVPREQIRANAAPSTMWAVYSAGYHLYSAARCQESDMSGMSEVEGEVSPREGGNINGGSTCDDQVISQWQEMEG